jgi:hypothetical protein
MPRTQTREAKIAAAKAKQKANRELHRGLVHALDQGDNNPVSEHMTYCQTALFNWAELAQIKKILFTEDNIEMAKENAKSAVLGTVQLMEDFRHELDRFQKELRSYIQTELEDIKTAIRLITTKLKEKN